MKYMPETAKNPEPSAAPPCGFGSPSGAASDERESLRQSLQTIFGRAAIGASAEQLQMLAAKAMPETGGGAR